MDVLDDEIRRSALASSYELLMEHTPEQVLPSTPASGTGFGSEAEDLERNVLHEEAVPIPEPQVNSEITTDAPAAAEPISGATRVLSGGRMRFTEWLEVSSGKVEVESIEAPRLAESGPSPSIEAEPGFPGGTVDSKALIDQFIQQTLPAPRPKTEFYTPQQAAKRSLDDTAGMVTETLARIYAKQGNTAKAVEAYRKLALKYPDKSAYFAALSKALEEH